jgi:hypothetical protein
MSAKIRIKGEPQRISKNAACCLVRRLLAVWIVRNLEIERVQPQEAIQPSANRQFHPAKPYIPAQLPPAELPGLRFKMPELTKTLWPDTVFPDFPSIVE